jgi:hypothetical protein
MPTDAKVLNHRTLSPIASGPLAHNSPLFARARARERLWRVPLGGDAFPAERISYEM